MLFLLVLLYDLPENFVRTCMRVQMCHKTWKECFERPDWTICLDMLMKTLRENVKTFRENITKTYKQENQNIRLRQIAERERRVRRYEAKKNEVPQIMRPASNRSCRFIRDLRDQVSHRKRNSKVQLTDTH